MIPTGTMKESILCIRKEKKRLNRKLVESPVKMTKSMNNDNKLLL